MSIASKKECMGSNPGKSQHDIWYSSLRAGLKSYPKKLWMALTCSLLLNQSVWSIHIRRWEGVMESSVVMTGMALSE